MLKAEVRISDKGRRSYHCPRCGSRGRTLKQSEVFLRGDYPAPGVIVRECKSCGTLFEHDKWLADRSFWRGIA